MKHIFFWTTLVWLFVTNIFAQTSTDSYSTTAFPPSAPGFVNTNIFKDFTYANALINLFDTPPESGDKKLSKLQRKALNALFPTDSSITYVDISINQVKELIKMKYPKVSKYLDGLSISRKLHERCTYEDIEALFKIVDTPPELDSETLSTHQANAMIALFSLETARSLTGSHELELSSNKDRKPDDISSLNEEDTVLGLTKVTIKETLAFIKEYSAIWVQLLSLRAVFISLSNGDDRDVALMHVYKFLSGAIHLNEANKVILFAFLFQDKYRDKEYTLDDLDNEVKGMLYAIYAMDPSKADRLDLKKVSLFVPVKFDLFFGNHAKWIRMAKRVLFKIHHANCYELLLYLVNYFGIGPAKQALVRNVNIDYPNQYTDTDFEEAFRAIQTLNLDSLQNFYTDKKAQVLFKYISLMEGKEISLNSLPPMDYIWKCWKDEGEISNSPNLKILFKEEYKKLLVKLFMFENPSRFVFIEEKELGNKGEEFKPFLNKFLTMDFKPFFRFLKIHSDSSSNINREIMEEIIALTNSKPAISRSEWTFKEFIAHLGPEARNFIQYYKIIDKTASFVARNGVSFETRIIENERGNPKFSFLQITDPYRPYYDAKVTELRTQATGTTTTGISSTPVIPPTFVPSSPGFPPTPSSTIPSHAALHPPRSLDFAKLYYSTKGYDGKEEILQAPPMSAMTRDIIQLTALFAARNGRSFVSLLVEKESANPQFEFLKSSTSVFYPYFARLVEAYTKLMAPTPALILSDAKKRSEYKAAASTRDALVQAEQKLDRELFLETDWTEFVVTERVMIPERWIDSPETATYAIPLLDLDQFKTMPLIQQRQLITNILLSVGAAPQQQVKVVQEQILPPVIEPPSTVEEEEEMIISSGESEEEEELLGTDEMQYVPRAMAIKNLSSSAATTQVCPLCKLRIPVDELSEHVRLELLDPKWKEQSEKHAQRTATSNLIDQSKISDHLQRLVRDRSDL